MAGTSETSGGAAYANALAGAAHGRGGTEAVREVGEALAALRAAWEGDRRLRGYFLSSRVASDTKRSSLERLAGQLPPLLGTFVRLLHSKGRLHLLPAIGDAFASILDRRLGRVGVTLTTATPMPAARLESWTRSIASATGRTPVLRHVVRPDLVAGAVLRIGDVVADGSVRRRLAALRHHIVERANAPR